MKKVITLALVAVLSILLLAGCTLASEPYASTQGYARRSTTETESVAAETGEPTQISAGYRGGNGNPNANYSDDCDPVYTGETTADPNFALSETDKALSLNGYGSEGALQDESLTLADMLTYAIQDEYLAHAEYNRILSENGDIRPFSNIIRAEETHIAALMPLFDAYGIAAPADDGASHTVAVASLTEAYQAGVNAEVNNIAMYENFLAQDLPDDVRTVFESLLRASENHLRAFQNRL